MSNRHTSVISALQLCGASSQLGAFALSLPITSIAQDDESDNDERIAR